MTRPRDGLQFGAGVLWLVVAILHLFDPSGAHAGIFRQYSWLVWLIGSIGFFFSAYRKPSAPSNK